MFTMAILIAKVTNPIVNLPGDGLKCFAAVYSGQDQLAKFRQFSVQLLEDITVAEVKSTGSIDRIASE